MRNLHLIILQECTLLDERMKEKNNRLNPAYGRWPIYRGTMRELVKEKEEEEEPEEIEIEQEGKEELAEGKIEERPFNTTGEKFSYFLQ